MRFICGILGVLLVCLLAGGAVAWTVEITPEYDPEWITLSIDPDLPRSAYDQVGMLQLENGSSYAQFHAFRHEPIMRPECIGGGTEDERQFLVYAAAQPGRYDAGSVDEFARLYPDVSFAVVNVSLDDGYVVRGESDSASVLVHPVADPPAVLQESVFEGFVSWFLSLFG